MVKIYHQLSQIIPKAISIEISSGLAERLGLKGVSASRFINGVIQLDRFAPEGTEFHEVFHVVFRTFLTDSQIDRIYAEAQRKYGTPTESQLSEFIVQEPTSRSRMSIEELTNLWYEENMAEEFRAYMNSDAKTKEETNKTWLGRIFEKLWNLIKSIFSKRHRRNKIESLFESIKKGKYVNATPKHNVFSNNSTAPFALLKSVTTRLNRPMLRSESNRILSGITSRLYKKLAENPEVLKGTEEYNKLIIEAFAEEKYYYSFDSSGRKDGNWNAEIEVWKKEKEKFFPEEGTEEEIEEYMTIARNEFHKIIDPIIKMSNAIPVLALNEKGEIIVINDIEKFPFIQDNYKEIMRNVESLMDFHRHFDQTIEELNELERNEQELGESWQRDAYENGGYQRIGDKLRAIIQFATAPIDEFGFGLNLLKQGIHPTIPYCLIFY